MHAIEQQLRQDHHNMYRLLDCIQQQIDLYETDIDQQPDLSIILDALDYIHNYPEIWHHPIEDIIFKLLEEKNAENRQIISSIRNEHQELEKQVRKAEQLFQQLANDCIVPVDLLTEFAQQMVDQQKRHIERENVLVYPLLNEHLTEADWKNINELVQNIKDPLFESPLHSNYVNLRQYIIGE